jgi:hypothetical protein
VLISHYAEAVRLTFKDTKGRKLTPMPALDRESRCGRRVFFSDLETPQWPLRISPTCSKRGTKHGPIAYLFGFSEICGYSAGFIITRGANPRKSAS